MPLDAKSQRATNRRKGRRVSDNGSGEGRAVGDIRWRNVRAHVIIVNVIGNARLK